MAEIWSLAVNSWKQFVRDRIFYLVLLVALFLVGFSYLLATLTIVESRKILLDFGFAGVSIAGAFMGIFLGIVAVAREIENKTIYTIITKPVSRTQYLLGKFLGSFLVLLVAHIALAITLAGIVKMGGESLPMGYFSCCALILMESTILLGVASFFSVFTSTILASGFSFAIFLVGRSNQTLMTLSEKGLTEEVRRVARVLYNIFPNFERYNIREIVAYEKAFPDTMLVYGFVYMIGYLLICLMGASLIFSKRDLP